MRTRGKRILSFILCVVMIFEIMITTALSIDLNVGGGGTGATNGCT